MLSNIQTISGSVTYQDACKQLGKYNLANNMQKSNGLWYINNITTSKGIMKKMITNKIQFQLSDDIGNVIERNNTKIIIVSSKFVHIILYDKNVKTQTFDLPQVQIVKQINIKSNNLIQLIKNVCN